VWFGVTPQFLVAHLHSLLLEPYFSRSCTESEILTRRKLRNC